MIEVRTIRPGEGRLLREVRLAALAANPGAFLETLEEVAADSDDLWEARAAASAPMEAVVSPLDAMRRSRIPVRVVIHSSLVSTIFSRSAFVNVAAGTSCPQPVMCVVRFGICARPVVPPMRCSLIASPLTARAR